MSVFTRKMKMLTAVVMDNHKDAVVKALLELGVMEFVHIDSIPSDKLSSISAHKSDISKAALSDMRIRIEGLFDQAKIDIPEISDSDVDNAKSLDYDSAKHTLDRLSSSIQTVKDEQKSVNQSLLSTEEMIGYIDGKKLEFLDLRVGTITGSLEDLEKRLKGFSGVFISSSEPYVSLTLRRDSNRVTELMDKFGWTESVDKNAQKGAMNKALEVLKKREEDQKEELRRLSEKFREKITQKKDELVALWKSVRINELSEKIESYFSYTKNTTLLSGWVPKEYQEATEGAIYKATEGKCIIEWKDDSEVDREDVPVAISSPKFFRPFEHLVKNYATPEYGSINPTPFTTVAYILMFMLMFADLGQGLVLLLIGIFGSIYYKKNPMVKDGLLSRYLCNLLIYLGPASMVGGILFGSFFGFSVFPALWFNYHSVVNGHGGNGLVNDIYDILGITIYFGIAIIYLGLILNWINLFRKKRYLELIFDKNGLVGGFLFGLGIWFGYGFVKSNYKVFPSAPWFKTCLMIGIILVVIKVPVERIYDKIKTGKKIKIGSLIMDTFMETLVEGLEIFSGFLANTLSFMRVAGLGIAHVSLMTAFEDMADLTSSLIFKIFILILGNLLVIALEGLSAGIQSLRLNYYEFFTKYFTGHGIAYEPVGLKSRVEVEK